jgi:hypothetical protein
VWRELRWDAVPPVRSTAILSRRSSLKTPELRNVWKAAPARLPESDKCFSTSLISRGDQFRDARNARVACKQIAVRIHGHIVGFDKLGYSSARSIANRTEHVAIPVYLENLAILTLSITGCGDPRIACKPDFAFESF